MVRKKRRKFPIFLAIIILVIILFGVMLKWNSGYTQSVSGSTDVYNKFKDAVISGGTVSLSSDDINNLISKSFESQTHKGVTIKNIYVNMGQNKLDIKIPVAFKGQNFLVSSRGSVALKDGCIAYLPDSFKIGAIPLSKSFVLSKLKAMYSSKFTIETDGIYINKSAVPITINSIEVKDNNLKIGVDKLKINLGNNNAEKIRDELANTVKDLNPSDKAKVEDAIKYIDKNPGAVADIKSKLSSVSSSEVKKVIDEIGGQGNNNPGNNNPNNTPSNQGTKKIDSQLASELSKELATASNKVNDAAGKSLVNAVEAEVASGTLNAGPLKAQFNALNETQRSEVRSAVVTSVSPFHIAQIQSIFR